MSAGPKLELTRAQKAAGLLLEMLQPFCERIEVAGSVRRQRPMVGDLELVAIPKMGERMQQQASLFGGGPAVGAPVPYSLLWEFLDSEVEGDGPIQRAPPHLGGVQGLRRLGGGVPQRAMQEVQRHRHRGAGGLLGAALPEAPLPTASPSTSSRRPRTPGEPSTWCGPAHPPTPKRG